MALADPQSRTVEVRAFEGRSPVKVALFSAAPFGWWPALCMGLVALIDRLEQSVLAGALPDIQDEFGISDFSAGLIPTAAGIAGVLLYIPSVRIANKAKRTRAQALIITVWSLLSLGSGLVTSFAMLFALRVALGGAAALNNPMVGSLIGDYYPRAGRSRAFGIERLAYFLGNPIGIIAGGVIAEVLGWRWVFIGLVIPGLLVAVLVGLLKEPRRGAADELDLMRLRADDASSTSEDLAPAPVGVDALDLTKASLWKETQHLFRIPALRAVLISQGLLLFGLGGLFFWAPTYFGRQFDLEEGAAAGISGGMGLLGILIGFFLGSRLGDRHQGVRPGWRITLGAVGLAIGAVGVALLAAGMPLGPTVGAWVILNIGFSISIPNFTAATADLSGAKRRSEAFAALSLIIAFASLFGPAIVGLVSDIFGSLRISIAFMVVPLVFAVFASVRARATYDADCDRSLTEDRG